MLRRLLTTLTLCLAASCASVSRSFDFQPKPAEVMVQSPGEAHAVARVLVSVPGARRDGDHEDGLPRMIVRLRIENRGEAPLRLELPRFKLVDSNLVPFGPAELREGPQSIDPGTEALYSIGFPYPEGLSLGAPQIEGINLQWVLSTEAQAWESSLTLERVQDPYEHHEPHFNWGATFIYSRGC
ncbi:MAG: hypothetical protein ACI8QC_002328 [Planctomycetota bacterium]|jgi:hypothetical protein